MPIEIGVNGRLALHDAIKIAGTGITSPMLGVSKTKSDELVLKYA